MNDELMPPEPAGLIGSLAALGYTLEAAVADLVDNSIDAGASEISVYFHWDPDDAYVVIRDNGGGMSEAVLRTAMTFAGRGLHDNRADGQLGRFGMGLKTASLSQARQLTVWSVARDHQPAVRQWDLDHVTATKQWHLQTATDPETNAILDHYAHEVSGWGTVVLWRKLTHLIDELADLDEAAAHLHFLQAVDRVDKHLGMVFARFLTGAIGRSRISLKINGADVAPWDPFMERHPETRPQPVGRLALGNQTVTVRPFILPPKKKLSDDEYARGGGPLGWLDQQGFYVYRNDRLIVTGGWLGLPGLRSDEKHVLARIAVEIPSDLDFEWAIDVKKATATPPAVLRQSLITEAKATRTLALRTLTSISRVAAVTHADELSYVWSPERKDGQTKLRINWIHPLVRDALMGAGEGQSKVRDLLRFMEETVPIPALVMLREPETEQDYQPFANAPSTEIENYARRMFNAFLSHGLTVAQARTRLFNTYPFNEYPDLPARLQLGE